MGIYMYSISTKPCGSMDGIPVHPMRFSRRLSHSWDGVREDEKAMDRIQARHQGAGLLHKEVLVLYGNGIYKTARNNGFWIES